MPSRKYKNMENAKNKKMQRKLYNNLKMPKCKIAILKMQNKNNKIRKSKNYLIMANIDNEIKTKIQYCQHGKLRNCENKCVRAHPLPCF